MTLVKVNNPISKSLDGLMNEIFNDLPVNFGKTVRENVLGFPAVNILEKEEAYHIQVAAPGLEKTDFSIKIDANLLTISSVNKVETIEENVKQIRKEFSFKSFKRSFTIDEKIDLANISAQYEKGILNVVLTKKVITPKESKEITIQ